MNKYKTARAILPCRYCGSTMPGSHRFGCELVEHINTAVNAAEAAAYQRGYRDALKAVADEFWDDGRLLETAKFIRKMPIPDPAPVKE